MDLEEYVLDGRTGEVHWDTLITTQGTHGVIEIAERQGRHAAGDEPPHESGRWL